MKHEWRKAEKDIYLPKKQPMKLTLAPMKYFSIEGEGNPNSKSFSEAVGALYAMSYGVKTSPKKGMTPEGYFDYTVYPLEGFWSLNEKKMKQFETNKTFRKEDLRFKVMIRQPDFVTHDFALAILKSVSKKKPTSYNPKITFDVIEEGLCVQALHGGFYDTESRTFSEMEFFCSENKLQKKIRRY